MFRIRTKIYKPSIFILAIILMIFFYGLSIRSSGHLPWHQQIVVGILAPFQKSVTFIGRSISDMWKHYFSLVGVSEENDRLKTLLEEKNFELIGLRGVESENNRLRLLNKFAESHSFNTVGADVIANDPRSDLRAVSINVGSSSKLTANMPVVAAAGLVGRVAEVAGGSSRVLLITDPNSAVDVVVQRSEARALLVGSVVETVLTTNHFLSRLEYLRRKSDILEGDILVTSGFDGIYPSGIPVGVVSKLEHNSYGIFREAEVVPFVDFSSLAEVLVVID